MGSLEFVVEIELHKGDDIEYLEVWRMPSGALLGIDSTWLESVGSRVADPYDGADVSIPEEPPLGALVVAVEL